MWSNFLMVNFVSFTNFIFIVLSALVGNLIYPFLNNIISELLKDIFNNKNESRQFRKDERRKVGTYILNFVYKDFGNVDFGKLTKEEFVEMNYVTSRLSSMDSKVADVFTRFTSELFLNSLGSRGNTSYEGSQEWKDRNKEIVLLRAVLIREANRLIDLN